MKKIILHVDMDAFFASVEQVDNKSLRGKPVIVGGVSERGVVSTCSYEARKYGVSSAMPAFIARQKCPTGIFLPVRHNRYKEVSEKIFKIFREVTPLIEPLSIDEAYLDLSESTFKTGEEAAKYIKTRVYRELGLTLSIGISYNKFLAKLASDWNKPNGIKIIDENMLPDILFPLPIRRIHGLGKKACEKLNNMGIFKVEDLYKMDKEFFIKYLGKYGIEIYERIRGIDKREVKVSRDRKSVGKEKTLKSNTNNIDELKEYLMEFAKKINEILDKTDKSGRTITLKYKTGEFQNHTRSKTLSKYIQSFEDIYEVGCELLEETPIEEEIRLIGLSIYSFREEKEVQLKLF